MKRITSILWGEDGTFFRVLATTHLPRLLHRATLRNYGGYLYEGELVAATDRIRRVTDGIANLEGLRNIFLVDERALFEWIVSHGSLQEVFDKRDPGHMQWLYDIADHSQACLEDDGSTLESEA